MNLILSMISELGSDGKLLVLSLPFAAAPFMQRMWPSHKPP